MFNIHYHVHNQVMGATSVGGWPLGSRLWCLAVGLLLSHWYPGSGVVLNCIDS